MPKVGVFPSAMASMRALCWSRVGPYTQMPNAVARPVYHSDLRAALKDSIPGCSPSGHYDFIEVGSSDWGTLTQCFAGSPNEVSWLATQVRSSLYDTRWVRGIVVEPVREYLDSLPRLPRVVKVEAAMDEFDGDDVLHCVSGENAERYMGVLSADLPNCPGYEVDVMWYAKSLSSLGAPHPDLEPMLRQLGRLDLLEQRQVCVLSWTSLCAENGVTSVDLVQLDCEGRDCAILRGLLAHCSHEPKAYPRLIQFEANHLTPKTEVAVTLKALRKHGYRVIWKNAFNIVVERSTLR